MLVKQKKANELITGDVIFGAAVYGTDVRYNTFRVLDIKQSDEHEYQLNIKRKSLTYADDEELESTLVINSNSDLLIISNSNVVIAWAFVFGLAAAGLAFGLTYPYFLNCY